ncbi:hypothetical protein BDZ94DRAFT_1177136, partial [Collybia nuda]
MKSFISFYGGTSQFRHQLLQCITEYVPTTFNPDVQSVIDRVEHNSGLLEGTLLHARFIKAAHKRKDGQQSAHAIFGFTNREAANHAMHHGTFVEGKHVLLCKLLPKPTRCMKCQKMADGHITAKCQHAHDVCAKCAGHHRTSACAVEDQDNFRCSNCTGTDSKGHGAGNRRCPHFLATLKKLHSRIPDTQYKYFPTASEPWTW